MSETWTIPTERFFPNLPAVFQELGETDDHANKNFSDTGSCFTASKMLRTHTLFQFYPSPYLRRSTHWITLLTPVMCCWIEAALRNLQITGNNVVMFLSIRYA